MVGEYIKLLQLFSQILLVTFVQLSIIICLRSRGVDPGGQGQSPPQ